jgi:pimeloyl-ACP methyl ester carboxylesterase
LTVATGIPVVLVHGAWFGAWCWWRVEEGLADAAMQTHAIDLPGRPANPLPLEKVTLEGWVDYLEYVVEGLGRPCVVVGHSVAGAALTVLGERRPELIDRLIYVAGFLLRSGESATDVIRRDRSTQVLAMRRIAADHGSSTVDPMSISTILCNDCPEDAKLAIRSSLVPESTNVARTKVHWTEGRFGAIARTYVVCEQDRVIDPSVQRNMVDDVGCDQVHALDTGHSPFLSRPQDLAKIIAMAMPAPV